jgi:hypothetical protein
MSVIGLSTYLLAQPVYDDRWFNEVLVEQRYTLGEDSSSVTLRGSENLDGIEMSPVYGEARHTERTNFSELATIPRPRVEWVSVDQSVDRLDSDGDTVLLRRQLQLHSILRPYRMYLTYRSSLPFVVESDWSHGSTLRVGHESDSMKIFSWYSFPDTDLVVPVTFRLSKEQRVVERAEIVYDSLALDLRLRRDHTNVQYRTIVTAVDTFWSTVEGFAVQGDQE